MHWKPFSPSLRIALLALGLLWCAGVSCLRGAAVPAVGEVEAFNAASKQFEDQLYDLAEKRFAEFVARYPDSERRAEAVLHEAESLYFENKLDASAALLNAELGRAGEIADHFQFWLAEILFKRGEFLKASDAYLKEVTDFQKSALRTEAIYKQALSFARLGNWTNVVATVGPGNNLFLQAAAAKPEDEPVLQGRLLLAEASLSLSDFDGAAKVLAEIGSHKLSPIIAWRRLFLLCKLETGFGHLANALTLTTNLAVLANSLGQPPLAAESVVLQGELLEKLERRAEAAELYEQNLALLPPLARRHALLKVIDYYLDKPGGENPANTTGRLEAFIQQNPNDEVSGLVRLTLGELWLKRAVAGLARTAPESSVAAAGVSNGLWMALTNLNQVMEKPPAHELTGRAFLDKGWGWWFLDRPRDAEAAFQKAVQQLPVSAAQTVARFKLADSQFKLHEFAEAQTNYRSVLRDCTARGEEHTGLFDQAIYQLLRTSLLGNDPSVAQEAVHDLLEHFPGSALTDPNLFLFGRTLSEARRPEEARKLLSEFVLKFPESSLLPEAELTLAGTFMDTGDFAEAYRRYADWVDRHPSHPSKAQAVFSEALAADKAGLETNSFSMMTNFLASFPADPLEPLARRWLADSYFNQQNYTEAEKNYQVLYLSTNAPKRMALEARLMAGRAATERQGVSEASTYFKQLMDLLQKDTNAPPALVAETAVLLGDTLFQQFLQSTNKAEQEIRGVITAYSLAMATNAMPGSIYEARALGRIGDCHFQYSSMAELTNKVDPNGYTNALNAYLAVLACPGADAAIRSQAEVKIGQVLERQHWPDQALERYANVIYSPGPGDARWVLTAAINAARIYEEKNPPQWDKAINIYRRLEEILPALRTTVEKRIASLQQKVPPAKL